MPRFAVAVFLLAAWAQPIYAQTANSRFPHQPRLTSQNSGTANGLIAVSPVNAKVVWASGRNGTFTKTIDGGKIWRAGVVPGAEALQFRDVQGINEKVAYLLSIGNGTDARIYKTVDGGKIWSMQFQNQDPNAFYDCFAFWTPNRGLAQSDAVNGRFPVIRTRDGVNWEDIGDRLPPAQTGEASFASSGTCVATQGERNAWIVTGGAEKARVLATRDGGYNWRAFDTPITQGTPSSGIFSVDFRDERHGMIGGGELDPALPNLHRAARSRDGGKTWRLTTEPPNIGTIYGLSYANEPALEDDHRGSHDHDFDDRGRDKDFDDDHDDHDDGNRTVVITGPGGSAWTPDEGNTWFTLPGLSGFWGVAFANSHTGWLVGVDGEITRIDF
jgi:photosystem II stability/assembly factor-like uncharacterized protein